MNIIILEGSDGTGKSTLAKHLKDKTGGSVLRKFPPSLPEPEDITDPLREALFYLNGMANDPFLRGQQEADTLICDRSFLTTMVYQGYTSGPSPIQKNPLCTSIFGLGHAAFFSRIKQPFSVSFVRVTCDLETSLDRMDSRNISKEEKELDRVDRLDRAERKEKLSLLNVLFSDAFYFVKTHKEFFLKTYGPQMKEMSFLDVDTSNSSVEDTLSTILAHHP